MKYLPLFFMCFLFSGDSLALSISGGEFSTALLGAFVGGVILNLMPCVFPVLSLKVISLAKIAAGDRSLAMRYGIFYLLGISFTFCVLSIFIYLTSVAGESVGWGMQMQSPVFLVSMIYVLFFVALNFAGFFDIGSLPLPSQFISGTSNIGYFGIFLSGTLAVLLSTPCSVPFMAPVVGVALSSGAFEMFAIMQFLGFGLAFPYILVSFVPFLRVIFPKPGAWMIVMKESMSFLLFASAVWLLYVLGNLVSSIIIYFILIGLIISAFSIWLFRFFAKKSAILKVFVFIVLVSANAVWVDFSFSYSEISQYFKEHKFSTKALDKAIVDGKNVLVIASADWCLTCKVNEKSAISTKEFSDLVKKYKIYVFKADWTKRDKEIADYLSSFGVKGVPFYVFYKNGNAVDIRTLPTILTKDILLNHTEEFFGSK